MAILNTERLILRALQIRDLDDVFDYCCTPNVGPHAGWKPHESKEETLEIMNTIFLNKATVWGIEQKETGRIIGSIGLIDDPKREYDRVKMVGYAIGEAYWGKGYMTEAMRDVVRFGFEELNLAAISAYCFPFNKRSKNVLKKCHFEYEGTLKMVEEIFNGNIYDNDCYLLTAQRYHSSNSDI